MAKFRAPRLLGPKQIEAMVVKLREFSGVQYDLAVNFPDTEFMTLLVLIDTALFRAGWKRANWAGQSMPLTGGVDPQIGINVGVLDVAIGVHGEHFNDELGDIARALALAIAAEGIAATAIWIPPTANHNPAAIHVMVGTKT